MDGLFILGILLFFVGFFLIGLEVIIPGFGLPGILGGCCLIAGLIFSTDSFRELMIVGTIVLILLAIFLFVIIVLLSNGKLKMPLILSEKQHKEDGYRSADDLTYLIGKHGLTTTDLRPSGKMVLEGSEYDVLSDGRFISQDKRVEIFKVSNSSLVVREAIAEESD